MTRSIRVAEGDKDISDILDHINNGMVRVRMASCCECLRWGRDCGYMTPPCSAGSAEYLSFVAG